MDQSGKNVFVRRTYTILIKLKHTFTGSWGHTKRGCASKCEEYLCEKTIMLRFLNYQVEEDMKMPVRNVMKIRLKETCRKDMK